MLVFRCNKRFKFISDSRVDNWKLISLKDGYNQDGCAFKYTQEVLFFAADGLTRSQNLLLAHASTVNTHSRTMFVRMCFAPLFFIVVFVKF